MTLSLTLALSLSLTLTLSLSRHVAPLPPQYSPALQHLVQGLLSTSPADRPSVAQLLSMPLLRRCIAAYAVTVSAKDEP